MMSRSHFAAPVLILIWLAAQLWVYLPLYSSVIDAALLTKLMVEEIAISLMATSNSPTRGHPKFPQAAQPDYDVSGWMAKRAAASLSL